MMTRIRIIVTNSIIGWKSIVLSGCGSIAYCYHRPIPDTSLKRLDHRIDSKNTANEGSGSLYGSITIYVDVDPRVSI